MISPLPGDPPILSPPAGGDTHERIGAAMSDRSIGVAVVGFGWMGRVPTQAYLRVRLLFPGLPLAPELVAAADEVPGRAQEAAALFIFTTPGLDWREVAADP